MKLAVIGTGYVGLVAGTCFADAGNEVGCVDIDAAKIAMLREGRLPIYEPGLAEMVQHNVEESRLQFTTDFAAAVKSSEVVFIAVGTPENEDGSADLRHVLSAAKSIGEAMDGPRTVVVKSTVPVGTNTKVRDVLRQATQFPFAVVSNPEFLKEGAAVEDFLKPDRVVIGAEAPRAFEVMRKLYAPFVRSGKPILEMDPASAEMTKYAANALLATKISFINQIAQLCEKTGADVEKVRRGIGSDQRIGPHFLFPGAGYGGSCFPKDVQALIRMGRDAGVELGIVASVDAANDRQKEVLGTKIRARFGEDLKGRLFAVWGLAFKPRTDDMREAPSIVLIENLLAHGAKVRANDPEAMEQARKKFGDRIEYCKNPYDCLSGADALAVVTEWNEYRGVSFEKVKSLLKNPVVFDGRNLYEPETLQAAGIEYHSMGRGGGPWRAS